MALLKKDHEQYAPYDLDFCDVLHMLLSLKITYALLPFIPGGESEELAQFLEGLEDMDILQVLHEISCVFVRSGADGSVKLPLDTELGKSLNRLLDPGSPEQLPDGFDPTGVELEDPDFISSLLGTSAKFFRTAVPGLVGTDSDVSVKRGLCGLQLPSLGDEVLVFARRKDAEKFKDGLSFPTKLVVLEQTGWTEI